MNNYHKNYDVVFDLIEYHQLTPEQVMNIFIYWHGRESITSDFIDHVREEITYL